MELNKFFKTIIKRKNIIAYWVIAGIIIAILVTIFQKPVYITKAKWFIQKASSGSVLSGAGSSSEGNALASAAGLLFNSAGAGSAGIDAAILESPEIINSIIEKLEIKDTTKKNLITLGEFRKRFNVKTDKKLPFIEITYSSNDPQEAYDVLKTAEEVFINKNVTAEAKKAQLNREFLENRVIEAELDSDRTARKLRNYESEAQVVDIEEEAKQQQTRLLDLQNDLATYEAQLASVKSKVGDLKGKLSTSSTKIAIEKSIIGTDTDINKLKSELLSKNNKLIELQVKYTDKHHAVIETKDEIEKLKSEIEKRQKALIGKSFPAESIEDVRSVKSGMIDDLVKYSTEEASLVSKIDAIENTLGQYSKDLSVLPGKKFRLTTLEFENEFQKSRLESIKLSYETAKINEEFARHTISIVKLDEPILPKNPTYPNLVLYILVGVICGLFFSYANILVLEAIDSKIRTPEQVEELTAFTYLGQISCELTDDLSKALVKDDSTAGEEYRKLRTNIKFLKVDTQNKSISLIYPETSIYPSIVLANLANSLSKANNKTLIVETNFREPVIHKIFKVDVTDNGLSGYLAGNIDNHNSVIKQVSNNKNLSLLPAGILPPNPSDILDSERMKNLVLQLANEYDMVLYNLPAYKTFADSLIVSNYLNGNILVANANSTTTYDFSYVNKVVKKHGIEILGSIFVNIPGNET
ncbi:MAG: polysaccharide biosynthesis tyrosine autokinase [Cyanobacteriota bacterium]